MNDIPVIWAFGNRGDRCHGILESMFAGDAWPTWLTFTHYTGLEAAGWDVQGAVVVVSAGVQRDYAGEIATALNRLDWSLVILSADEESRFSWRSVLGPNRKIWWQMPAGDKTAGVDRKFPIGYPTGTRDLLRKASPTRPEAARRYPWSFLGQMQHEQRRMCIEVLGHRKDGGSVSRTAGFSQGYPKDEFLKRLAESYIAPCPAGMYTTDCFREWESIEAGCLPVCDRRLHSQAKDYDYWADLLGCQPPFPVITDWREFNAIADRYAKDPATRQHDANRVGAWWIGYKRSLVKWLEEDLQTLQTDAGRAGATGVPSFPPVATASLPAAPIGISGVFRFPTGMCCADPAKAVGRIGETVADIRRAGFAEVHLDIPSAPVDLPQSIRQTHAEFGRQLVWACNWEKNWAGCLPVIKDVGN